MNTRAALLLALWPMVAWGDVTAYRIVNLTPTDVSVKMPKPK